MEKEMDYAEKKHFKTRNLVALLCMLAAIPLTLWIGWSFGNRNYYIVSVLIMIYTMIPFFMLFEKRKPQARELVILAVLCGIAVVSRAAFIWLPHFKPIIAIIIITGVALGPEAGFLTGAMSAFVSNFIFGQGPWTPWQMFAFGMAGLLAGVLVKKGVLKKTRLPICIFGGVVVVLVVGPILDTCTLFTMPSVPNAAGAAAIYLSGLPANIMLAAATVVTLLLVSKPMLEKVERVKMKYGMMEND